MLVPTLSGGMFVLDPAGFDTNSDIAVFPRRAGTVVLDGPTSHKHEILTYGPCSSKPGSLSGNFIVESPT